MEGFYRHEARTPREGLGRRVSTASLLTALLAGCGMATLQGSDEGNDPIQTDDPEVDPPAGPSGNDAETPAEEPEEPLPATPEGPVGACWGAEHFDDGCSLERAAARYESALFPGEDVAVLVSTSAVAGAVYVIWAPAGIDSAVGLTEAVVFDDPGAEGHGQLGSTSLALPSAFDATALEVVHANRASTAASWRGAWQDGPTGVISPFASAYYENGETEWEWRASPSGEGVQATLSVSEGGGEEVRQVLVDGTGQVSYRYEHLDAGAAVEEWTSADGQSWQKDAGDQLDLQVTSELLAWDLPLAPDFAEEGTLLRGRHGRWGPEMGWLEGDFAGLTALLAANTIVLSDFWVDVEDASVAALSLIAWDGEQMQEWTTSDGFVEEGVELPRSYQGPRSSRIDVIVGEREAVGVEVVSEEGEVRLVAEDLLPVDEIGGNAWRFEIVFETAFALATGEAAVERTTLAGDCSRRITYDFGTTWAAQACGL
ncbi:MAG: hypothetical protein HYY06_04850 [Deltaproteobacteria bacterium]|nr:hypothetical protein [Deltaproteobacteria bacterium]